MPDLLTDFVQYVRDELFSSIPVPIKALIVNFVLKVSTSCNRIDEKLVYGVCSYDNEVASSTKRFVEFTCKQEAIREKKCVLRFGSKQANKLNELRLG